MLDALTLDQMRTFVAVAEQGSFRAGAAQLLRAQSAISHAIANLEDQLQLKLFDRSGHKPTLTVEGRALLADIQAILVKVDAMRARAQSLGEGLELSLTLALDPLVSVRMVSEALFHLREIYPTVSLRIVAAPLGAAQHAVINRECALAITTAEQRDPTVERHALGPFPPFVAVCAPDHPLSRNRRSSAEDLADHLQIVVEDPSPMTDEQTFRVCSTHTWRVTDLATKRGLIIAGIGWGNLPFCMVSDDLDEGRMVRMEIDALGPHAETALNGYLLHRIDTPLGPAARAVKLALLQKFRSGQS